MPFSGPYNLYGMEQHLHKRGLDSSILTWICQGDLIKYSPTILLAGLIKSKNHALLKIAHADDGVFY
jgi:hypothetical protein